MLERIAGLENELRDVEMRLGDPAVQSDPRRLAELGRRHKQLSEIVATGRRLQSVQDDLDEARRMHGAADAAERTELREMIDELESATEAAAEELRVLLLPPDPNEGRNVIVEIRGAAGGEEANLFARDLFGMYQAFAKRQRWKIEPLAASPSDLGGYTEVSGLISGDQVWTRMKHEAGTHRVQRVPVTESQGRVHTSSATVSVLPEAEEVDVKIDEADLQIDVLPIVGSRWPVGEHHRFGGAGHARAQRHRGGHAGREEPAPEQAEGAEGAAVEAVCRPSRSGPRPSSRPCVGAKSAAATGPRRSAPTT